MKNLEAKLTELRNKYQEIINQIGFLDQQRQALINEALRIEGQMQLIEELMRNDSDSEDT